MQNEIFKGFESLNKTALDSARRLGEINVRALERLNARQLEAASDCLEGGVRQMQMLGEAKDVRDVLSGQSSLAAELNSKLVQHLRETGTILMDARGEYQSWMEDGLKLAAENPFNKVSGKKAA